MTPPDETVVPPRPDRAIPYPQVFWPAMGFCAGLVLIAIVFTDTFGDFLASINDTVVGDLGWWYILVVTGFVAFALWAALSPMGRIVLGKDDEPAEYGLLPWFSMLFAAGMGIGLVFWGVAEPLNHFASPPPGTPDDVGVQAQVASDITFLHWGLHAWAIYVVVGLAVAYAVHRKGRPVSIRWALEPLFGNRVKGWVGDVIDVLAIIGTLFGVATSLGFGVSQIGAGLGFMGWAPVDEDGSVSTYLLVGLIVLITLAATASVASGIDKGIKFLSNLNMGVAGVFLLTVLLLGPTFYLLGDLIASIGSYLQNFLRMSLQTLVAEGEEGRAWVSGWTTFYWGWWISWAPFVGVFIARISRGRTVREFVIGVLLVPTTVTFTWFTVMGGSALYREMFGEGGMIGADGAVSTEGSLFQLIDGLPMSTLLSVVVIFLVTIFFVTSSDSGSYVVDMLATGGNPTPPVWSRVLWSLLEGAIAAALLLAGGLDALRTMAILLAFPFSIVMVLMTIATGKELLIEHGKMQRAERSLLADEIAGRIMRSRDIDLASTAPPGPQAGSDAPPEPEVTPRA